MAAAAQERPAALPRPMFGETLLLALKVNGVMQDGMLRAVRLREGLAVSQRVWEELGLKLPLGEAHLIDGEMHRLLDTRGPARWRIDEASQTLEIDAPASAFEGQRMDLNANAARVTLPPQWATFINYDAQWQRSNKASSSSQSSADALWELGLFSPHGDFSSTALYRSSGGSVRLDSRWQRDDPDRMTKLRIGDSVNQAGSWGRAMRFGGVQWGTDFSLRPGFLSFPLPTLRGEASLPSTLDVFINNGQRLQSRLQPGPFDLSELPVVTGQGEIRTVVRDLLGREQIIVTPYYVSPALLKPGLRAFSFEVGALRQDYGLSSQRYGRALVSATERRGISERFSGELRAELASGQQAAGATGMFLWPTLGTASVSVVGSRAKEHGNGWMLAVGLDRQAQDWSGSLQVRQASPRFRQLGESQVIGEAPRRSLNLAIGRSWSGQALGLAYAQQSGNALTAAKLLSVNYGVDLRRWGSVGVGVFRDLRQRATSIGISWSVAIDQRHSAGVNVQRQPDSDGRVHQTQQTQVQRNAPFGRGLGYQLLTETGGRHVAQAIWQGDGAVFNGGVAKRGGDTDLRAGASGGVAWMDGSVHTSRRIEGGIALVEVGNHPDVRISHDTQIVARTDAKGRAFISGLRGYQSNRLGVEASDLPMDVEMEVLELKLIPAARSAAKLQFPVQRGRAATMRVIDAAGKPLPPASLLQVEGQARTFPVGLEGRSYVAGLVEGKNKVAASWAEGRCSFEVNLAGGGSFDDLPDLGLIQCR